MSIPSRNNISTGQTGVAAGHARSGVWGSDGELAAKKVRSETTPGKALDKVEHSLSRPSAMLSSVVRKHPAVSLSLSGAIAFLLASLTQHRSKPTLRERLSVAKTRIQDSAAEAQHDIGKGVESGYHAGHQLISDFWHEHNAAAIVAATTLVSGLLAASLQTVRSFSSRGKSSAGWSESHAPYEERSKEELYERARKLNIEGRSSMNKDDLIKALRAYH